MALSYVKYTANGSTNQFAVTFSYISASDVHVYINGVEDQSYTFVNSALVQTSSTPANGAIVEVRRQTSNTARLVDFQDGSVLTESDLDASANQNFFTVQENFDRTQDTIQLTATDVFDGQSKRITNVANPTSDQDVATKHYLENTWLTTANKTALTTVNANIANINAVNSNASNVNSAVANASNINTVSGAIANVNNVGGIASNVTTVAGISSNVTSVASNSANINTVATNIGSVNTVATDIAKVIVVANDLAEAVSEIETVANDLVEVNSEIDIVSDNIINVNTVGGISGNVTTVAGIASNVTTVAGISSAVTGVSNIASVVSAVNSNASNINSVNSNASNINTVAGAVSNVNNVGGDIANVNTVAGIASNVTAVAGKASEIALLGTSDAVNDLSTLGTSDVVNDMNVLGTSANVTAMNTLGTNTNVSNMSTLAGISGNITTVAGISSNVSTVAGISSAVSTVVGMSTAITTANSNSSNINTVAGAISNVNTVGGAIANVNTVASNISGVNSFGERYRISSSAPTSSLDVGDLYFDTSANELKVYKSSGWASAGSTVNGTSQRYHYDISGTPTTVSGADASGATLAYDSPFVDVYLNGIRMSTADITASSGTSIVFASALSNGDEVDIVAYGTFNVATVSASNLSSGTVPDARITGTYTGLTNLTMSGSLIVDTDTFKVDATNDRVHVNGTTGTRELNVSGDNTRLLLYSTNNSTGAGQLQFGDQDNEQIGRIMYEHDGNKMTFHTNGAEKMRIASDGKVGIGTTSPARSLHVNSADANVASFEGHQGEGLVISSGTNGRIDLIGYDDGASAYNNICMRASGGNDLFINTSGRVAIGSTSANGIFDVHGTVSAGGNTNQIIQRWRIGSDNVTAEMTYDDSSSTRGYQFGTVSQHDLQIKTHDAPSIHCHANGEVTMPRQPAFLATTNQNQQNVADGWVTVGANHEMFDQNSDYNTSTYHFTAPKTGKYVLFGKIAIEQMPNDYHWIYAGIGTSNRTHYGDLIDPREMLSGGDTSNGTSTSLSVQILADLDANDTAYLFLRSSSHGTNIMDITNTGTVNPDTFFSGYLAC